MRKRRGSSSALSGAHPGQAVPMHYVDSVQSRGLLLVVPSVDEICHDVGYCSRRGARAPRFRLCGIGACCAALVGPWICLRTGKWVIRGAPVALVRRRHAATDPLMRSTRTRRAASRGRPGHSPRGINASKTRNAPRLSAVVPACATAAGAEAAPDGSNSSRSPSASVPTLATLAYTPRQWSA